MSLRRPDSRIFPRNPFEGGEDAPCFSLCGSRRVPLSAPLAATTDLATDPGVLKAQVM